MGVVMGDRGVRCSGGTEPERRQVRRGALPEPLTRETSGLLKFLPFPAVVPHPTRACPGALDRGGYRIRGGNRGGDALEERLKVFSLLPGGSRCDMPEETAVPGTIQVRGFNKAPTSSPVSPGSP